eukprot:3440466-Amphidinium_carterae.1
MNIVSASLEVCKYFLRGRGCEVQTQSRLQVCDSFKNCEGLSRVAFMDGNGCVMLGKVGPSLQANRRRTLKHQGYRGYPRRGPLTQIV